MKITGKTETFSRRVFLHRALAFSSALFVHWLSSCRKQPQNIDDTGLQLKETLSVPNSPTLQLTDIPPSPSTTPKPTFTPSPIPDDAFFYESSLSPVCVARDADCTGYPGTPPYHPDTIYSEYPFSRDAIGSQNDAYRLIRQALRLIQPEGFGEEEWNPLQHIIRPGDRVLIKPNLVDASTWQNGQMTHPAILRPIIDYVYKACGPQGHIVVGDAPWAVDVFTQLVRNTGIQSLIDWLTNYTGIPITLVDLNTSEPQNTPLVDMGQYSEFYGVERTWFDGHGQPMLVDGEPGVGRYRISRYVFDADVVISVPKAKVHCSGGITVAMKNAIGIIPAWDGTYRDGYLKDCAHTSDVDQAAGDRGIYLDNDTIWRSMADLNRIIRFGDANGNIHTTPQRRILCIVDAIIAAEQSQYDPVPFPLNTVIVSSDPIAVDAITARCMGFDSRRLKSVQNAARSRKLPLGHNSPSEIKVHTNQENLCQTYRQALQPELHVYSWQGFLEADDFDAPEMVSWKMPHNGKLEVHVCDDSAVSWVRIEYEYSGSRKMQTLDLVQGNLFDGLWEAAIPLEGVNSRVNITAGDELFNECKYTIDI